MGGQGPASLADFAMEVQFWQRLGLRPADVDALPWKQAVEYSTYIELICQHEETQNNRPQGTPQPRV
jgi:hypothetical protein